MRRPPEHPSAAADERFALVLGALTMSEHDPAVRRLSEAFGGEPDGIRERLIGEPAVVSRRLGFASGAEMFVHDDTVVAVVLDLSSGPDAQGGLDLSDWIPGLDNGSTVEDFKNVFGKSWWFGGHSSRCFPVDGAFARFVTVGHSTQLDRVVVSPQELRAAPCPEDEGCEACADLVVRRGPAADFDLEATIESLADAVQDDRLREDAHWVRLADLTLLHSSGLMDAVESQFLCRTCGRVICLTLRRDAPPAVTHATVDAAMRRHLGVIPPVELWGDPERIDATARALRYVDHRPGSWFLLEKEGRLHLDARYSSGMVDGSVLVLLDESEREGYRSGGTEYLSELARRIDDSSPHREGSPYYARDLLRGADGAAYRAEVTAAIVNHSWVAEQRRRSETST